MARLSRPVQDTQSNLNFSKQLMIFRSLRVRSQGLAAFSCTRGVLSDLLLPGSKHFFNPSEVRAWFF